MAIKRWWWVSKNEHIRQTNSENENDHTTHTEHSFNIRSDSMWIGKLNLKKYENSGFLYAKIDVHNMNIVWICICMHGVTC